MTEKKPGFSAEAGLLRLSGHPRAKDKEARDASAAAVAPVKHTLKVEAVE